MQDLQARMERLAACMRPPAAAGSHAHGGHAMRLEGASNHHHAPSPAPPARLPTPPPPRHDHVGHDDPQTAHHSTHEYHASSMRELPRPGHAPAASCVAPVPMASSCAGADTATATGAVAGGSSSARTSARCKGSGVHIDNGVGA